MTKKRFYYLTYSICFLFMTLICFSWIIFTGRSLIWRGDGVQQHFKALVYYGQYLRKIVYTLFSQHRLVIPDWDFYIGEGSDIINTFHYYAIGDPIALLSVFVPTRFMHYFYTFACFLRIYLAGISFSALCFGTGQKNRYAVLGGALAYCFCKLALTSAGTHPYFLNPLIYFPLMILGIEKILQKKEPFLFIVATAISAVSNIYYFYMIAVLTAVYGIIRVVIMYKRDVKQIFKTIVPMGLYAGIGMCIAGAVFVPVLVMLMGDGRLSATQPFHLFYPREYYSKLPAILLNAASYELHIGVAVPALLATFLLFLRKKEDLLLKVLVIAELLIILFPIGGRILNGFSYMTNRWSFAVELLLSFILVKKWDELLELTFARWKKLGACCAVFAILCFVFEKSRTAATFSVVALLVVSLLLLLKIKSNKLLIMLVVAGCILNSFWKFSSHGWDAASEDIENSAVWSDWNDNELSLLSDRDAGAYTRITGTGLTRNANIFSNISSTQYYWSMSNPFLGKFRNDLYLREPQVYFYEGYDDRTSLLGLSAVRYYIANGESCIPYGFSYADEYKYFTYYENEYALPLGYCYDKGIKKSDWEAYNPVQKQEAQLLAAYVDEDIEGENFESLNIPDYLMPYDPECMSPDITMAPGRITTTAGDASVVLHTKDIGPHSEIYVCFEGLEFVPTPEYALYFGDESVDPNSLYGKEKWDELSDEAKAKKLKKNQYWNSIQDTSITALAGDARKVINYMRPDMPMSGGRHDFIANLGYMEEGADTVTVSFEKRGIYTFDSLSIYAVPMDDYPQKVSALKSDVLENIELGTDTITGSISLEEQKLLCLAMPYSKGWSAYIDGIKTPVYCLNERYLGISVPLGQHNIEYRYSTPYKKTGFAFSAMGVMSCLAVMLLFGKGKKRQ